MVKCISSRIFWCVRFEWSAFSCAQHSISHYFEINIETNNRHKINFFFNMIPNNARWANHYIYSTGNYIIIIVDLLLNASNNVCSILIMTYDCCCVLVVVRNITDLNWNLGKLVRSRNSKYIAIFSAYHCLMLLFISANRMGPYKLFSENKRIKNKRIMRTQGY